MRTGTSTSAIRSRGWPACSTRRGYPLGNLADCLDDAADVVLERVAGAEDVAERLRAAAAGAQPLRDVLRAGDAFEHDVSRVVQAVGQVADGGGSTQRAGQPRDR